MTRPTTTWACLPPGTAIFSSNLSADGAAPAAELSADIVNYSLQSGVLFGVEGLRILHEPNQEAEHIELQASFGQAGSSRGALVVAGGEETFDDFKNCLFASFVDSKAIVLGHLLTVGMKKFI